MVRSGFPLPNLAVTDERYSFSIHAGGPNNLGLSLLAPDDRTLLQVQSAMERAQSGFAPVDSARARVAAGAAWTTRSLGKSA